MVRWDFWILRDPLVPDDPVRVEHEDRPFRHALQAETPEAIVEHPVRRADFLVPVAQQRVVEVVLFLEDAMAVVTVRADAEHLRTPLLEVSHRVTHRAELALAHVREVPDVEGQDHRAAAELVRERDGRTSARASVRGRRGRGERMPKYVLAADYTLMTDYRNVPLATFFSCIPTDYWHSRLVFRILADPPKLDPEGRPIRVPYGLRKVEASLVRAYGRDSVVIADPRNTDRYIDDE